MHILFLYGNSIDPEKGGIQRVTVVLADYFCSQGHKVFYLSKEGTTKIENERSYYLPNALNLLCLENKQFLKNFIREKTIDIVINQSGMDPLMSNLAYSVKDTKAKLISCIHNALISQIQHFDTTYAVQAKKYRLGWLLPLTKRKIIKNFLLFLYKKKYAKHYNALCANSDKVVLLSPAFLKELRFFLKSDVNEDNITAISNPTSFDSVNDVSTLLANKQKQVLYVGRIDRRQKRVDLLLDIWQKLHHKYPEWSLKIVGGGKEASLIKEQAKIKNLKNINFEGFRDPKPYYRTASLFCMTSSYEGFGIVLAEAMTYGVVPLAFNSYLSVTDIIDDGLNGSLVEPFSIADYAAQLEKYMEHPDVLARVARQAIVKSKYFDINNIGETWLSLFGSVNRIHIK